MADELCGRRCPWRPAARTIAGRAPPVSLRFGTQVCGSPAEGAAREWLVPDGLGGYAMGTVTAMRTRRYHGLLVVSGEVPARRMMALASLDATVTLPSGASVQ